MFIVLRRSKWLCVRVEQSGGLMSTECETVLLVEGDEGLRDSLGELLQSDGYHILATNGAESALRLCAKHDGTIRFLITDMFLGFVSGFELAVGVASAHPDINIVFTTTPPSSMSNSNCQMCARAEVHFMPKPFLYSQLRTKLVQLSSQPADTPLKWLTHFFDERRLPKAPEVRHPIAVQLQAVELNSYLVVKGMLRQPDGREDPCLIEPRIWTSRIWRQLRVKDLAYLGDKVIQLTVRLLTDREAQQVEQGEPVLDKFEKLALEFRLLIEHVHSALNPLTEQLKQSPQGSERTESTQSTTEPALSKEIVPLHQLEREALLSALRQLKGNKTIAARKLGIAKATLYRKLKEQGIVFEPAVRNKKDMPSQPHKVIE